MACTKMAFLCWLGRGEVHVISKYLSPGEQLQILVLIREMSPSVLTASNISMFCFRAFCSYHPKLKSSLYSSYQILWGTVPIACFLEITLLKTLVIHLTSAASEVTLLGPDWMRLDCSPQQVDYKISEDLGRRLLIGTRPGSCLSAMDVFSLPHFMLGRLLSVLHFPILQA